MHTKASNEVIIEGLAKWKEEIKGLLIACYREIHYTNL